MDPAADCQATLSGEHVLVVEDDFLISMELVSILTGAGADVVGPSRTVRQSLVLVDQEDVSAAILDVRLGHDTVEPVARKLSQRNIPFIFYTGQVGNDPIWREWPDCTVVSKPAPPCALIAALAAVCTARARA